MIIVTQTWLLAGGKGRQYRLRRVKRASVLAKKTVSSHHRQNRTWRKSYAWAFFFFAEINGANWAVTSDRGYAAILYALPSDNQ